MRREKKSRTTRDSGSAAVMWDTAAAAPYPGFYHNTGTLVTACQDGEESVQW